MSKDTSKGELIMPEHKVALLTAGGIAPCLSAAVGLLIERYTELSPKTEIIGIWAGTRASCSANR